MFYLIGYNSLWLIAACALGVVVGAATFRSHRDRLMDGLVWAFVLAWAVGALVALARLLPDRSGYALELALVMSFAYAVGCFVGWVLRGATDEAEPVAAGHGADTASREANHAAPQGYAPSGGGFMIPVEAPKPAPVVEAPKPAPVVEAPKPAPVVETPKPTPVVEAPKPGPVVETPKPAPVAETPKPAPVVETPTPPAPAKTAKLADIVEAAKPTAAVAAPKPVAEASAPKPEVVGPSEPVHQGNRPAGLPAPRGKADDLKRIRGIGPQNEGRLHGLGIWHFDQIAAWTTENVEWVGSYLAFPGRIDREAWVAQAKVLATGEETEFSKRVDAGDVPTSKDDGSSGQSNVERAEPRKG